MIDQSSDSSLSGRYDVVIVGAGMAGASLGAELAGQMRVLVLEMEDQPGYHATGRSVAFWEETYGGPLIQPLTSASGTLLARPAPCFSETPFVTQRGGLHIGTAADAELRDQMVASFAGSGVVFEAVGGKQLQNYVPGIRSDYELGLVEPSTLDIDVAALHAAYLAKMRREGGTLLPGAALLSAARRTDGDWNVETRAGRIRAGLIVNAAGAWADPVAHACGVAPLGIQPLRRTVVQLRVAPEAPANLPVVMDFGLSFYFKPVGQGRLWLSPHDETPSEPCDAAAEELDVAIAIDRLQHVVDWRVEAVERRWAGLRSFTSDRLPVYGFDKQSPGFFWFAGQGGFGIQTAPAAALIGASLVMGKNLPDAVAFIDIDRYRPDRLG